MKAVVLAAGKGVRMRPLTDKIPKVMVELSGKPMLERIFEELLEAGITEVELIVGYKKEAIKNHFGKEFKGIKINYIAQEQQLGTAHAISLAEKHVEGDFLAMNGDVIVEKSLLKELVKVDEFDPHDLIIVGRAVRDPWRYGVLAIENDRVKGIVEKPAPGDEPSNIINIGVYRFNEKIFDAIKKTPKSERGEFEIVKSIEILIAKGADIGFKIYEGLCFDVGDIEDLRKAEELLRE